MNWIVVGGSLVAVLAVAAIAWLLRLGKGVALADEREAAAIAETMISGFEADQTWLSLDRVTAAVIGHDGGVALVRRHGARFVARQFQAPAFRQVDAFQNGGRIEIDGGDRLWGKVAITLENRGQAGELAQALAVARERAGRAADTHVS